MKSVLVTTKVNKLLRQHKGDVRLNIGCGTDYKEGWINIDNNSDNNITKLDLMWDLTKRLPFPDKSVNFIFSEHFFEHLSPEEAENIIKDLMRTLRPGGVMRIAMPDLEQVVRTYLEVPLSKDPVIKNFKFDYVKTRAEWMNMSFRSWGHKWLYDWEELRRRLKDTGFTKVKRCTMGNSTHAELQNLETRSESFLIAEVTK